MSRTIFELNPNHSGFDSEDCECTQHLKEKVFMAVNQLSPAGVPCKYENDQICPTGKLESVEIAKNANVSIWAIFMDLADNDRNQIAVSFDATEIPWELAQKSFVSPYLFQCVGFAESLGEEQKQTITSLLEDTCSGSMSGQSLCSIEKWDDTSSVVLLRAAIGADAQKVFGDFFRILRKHFDVRTWQGEEVE